MRVPFVWMPRPPVATTWPPTRPKPATLIIYSAFARMPARMSESFILQTYPFREADLVVSFFTRDQGKLRGVARRARRPKSNFGSGLERLSHVRMAFIQRENADLATLTGCELIESHFHVQADYG